jgi:Fe-S cluster assembly protein SufD
MAIHSFLKADKSDADWQFTPIEYFDTQFKIIEAATIELTENTEDSVVLRQNPTEKELLAKHLKIYVQENSKIDITILNDMDATLQQVFLYDIHMRPGSSVTLGVFARGGKLNKHIIQIYQESYSSFESYGLISNTVGGDTEVIVKVVHSGQGSESNQNFLGIAGKNSQTVYQGIALTEANSFENTITIDSSNLIIGEGGRCYAKPETYLNSEFVASSLTCTVDTISLEKIAYLQSRGISEEIARELVISGFRNQVIDLISAEIISDEMKEMYLN